MRHELARRPSVLIAGALICGLATAVAWPMAFPAFFLIFLPEAFIWRFAVLAAFVLGIASAPSRAPQVEHQIPFRSEVRVASIPDVLRHGQRLVVEHEGLQFMLRTRDTAILAPGDRIRVNGMLEPLFDDLGRDVNELALSGRIQVEPGGLTILERGPAFFRPGVEWRAAFTAFVRDVGHPRAASAINALCFNVRGDLDEQLTMNLQRSGTAHIVSASGLHVMIVAGGLAVLLGLLPIPRAWKLIVIGAILTMYAVGAGMKPPVVRSVIMAGILGLATVFRREPDLLSALGTTAAAYLVWRPAAVFEVGFQLSFVTVFALGMFLTLSEELPEQPLHRLGFTVKKVSMASLVATAASAPLTAYHFGLVSIVAIPANVLIGIALPFVTMAAFAAHGVSLVLPGAGAALVGAVVQPLSGWVIWVVETLGSLSFAAVNTPSFSAYWMAPYYLALLLIWRPRVRPI